jgi:IclR family pca regulon transcriptional regulator
MAIHQDKNLSVSLIRGLAILSSFSVDRPIRGITDLANELQLNKSTVHRYVETLQTLGYLEQDEQTRKFRLGIRVVDFAAAILGGMELRQIALPFLEALSAELGLTVNMSVLDGNDIVYIGRVRTNKIINLELYVGSRLPAYCTSMGKVLLAFLPPKELEAKLSQIKLEQRGPNTITDKAKLLEELHRIRERGFSINNEELANGLRSLGAPVRSRGGEVVAAINIAVHTSMTSAIEMQNVLAPKLLATADRISKQLGYRGIIPE